MNRQKKFWTVTVIAIALTLALATNLRAEQAPEHRTLRMTATAAGPYSVIEEGPLLTGLTDHTSLAIETLFPEATQVNFEAVLAPSTPKEVGNALQKLAQNLGANLALVQSDGEGSFLVLMVFSPESATFYALILHEGGTVMCIADLIVINKETQG